MNLDELRTVQDKERSKDSLQHLRESFYGDVADYVESLREERDRAAERADNPFDSDEVNRLTDEIQTAEDVVEAVYERRVGKVVKRASLSAAGMPADEEGLTSEEQDLFADLVARIESNKSHVLDVLAGEAVEDEAAAGESQVASQDGDPAAESPAAERTESDAGISPADAMGGGDPAGPAEDPTVLDEREDVADGEDDSDADSTDDDPTAGLDERTTVRITRDVGEIFGVDERAYNLASEDVVTLPAENAEPLLDRDAAEKLD